VFRLKQKLKEHSSLRKIFQMKRRDNMRVSRIKLCVMALAAVIAFFGNSAFASLVYDFGVDTSSLSGQSGYLDLQFNPGISSLGAASAAISNYSSDGMLLGTPQLTGAVTGTLPGTVTINNDDQYNDYFHAITFGNIISFSLYLTGSAGNSFALSFFDLDGSTPVLTTDLVNGYATIIDMNEINATVTNYSNQVSVNPVPIPASVLLFSSGLIGLAGFRKKFSGILD
jgi:hypothetical protein